MKFFTQKEVSRKIIIAIVLVMSFNFISPSVSSAMSFDEFGGALFKPISQLLLTVSDLFIQGIQKYFIGNSDITQTSITTMDTGANDNENVNYFIRYSPGIIFSGKVAGLKVNFINATEDDNEDIYRVDVGYSEIGQSGLSYSGVINYAKSQGASEDEIYVYELTSDNYNMYEAAKVHYIMTWTIEEQRYYAMSTEAEIDFQEWAKTLGVSYIGNLIVPGAGIANAIVSHIIRAKDANRSDDNGKYTIYQQNVWKHKEGEKESSAYVLKDTVATWYKALRAIALVGLLSVLVYIGIRILISSTGQEKAKYKKMITDWVAAICILFVLQYIMLIIIEITQRITNVLSVNITGPYGEDILMSNLRNSVGDSENFSIMFPELIMYMALVIYTIMFTIQYLKRLLYMAFFTMIAPLIALTYPLDKIKDGQAQAFTIWIREYIFNALLQPMHLLLYYIFVSSAMNLVNQNPLYAVVAIGFLLPAEKFFRKMFGFDKAASTSQLGAAAGGALIMNAVNKLGQRAGKAAAGGSGGGSDGGSGGSSGGTKSTRFISAPGGGNPAGSQNGSNANQSGTQSASAGGQGATNSSPFGGTNGGSQGGNSVSTLTNPNLLNTQISRPNATSGANKAGLKGVAKRYINKDTAKKVGRMARRGALGAAGAATLGTVGLAAGVASGDFGKTFQYGLAGAGAGYMGANALGDKTVALGAAGIKEAGAIRDTFEENKWGTDEFNTRKSVRDLNKDADFNRLCQDLNITDKDAAIRMMHNNGIKKPEDIKEVMNKMVKNPNMNRDEIVSIAKLRQKLQNSPVKMSPNDIKNELLRKGANPADADRAVDMINNW